MFLSTANDTALFILDDGDTKTLRNTLDIGKGAEAAATAAPSATATHYVLLKLRRLPLLKPLLLALISYWRPPFHLVSENSYFKRELDNLIEEIEVSSISSLDPFLLLVSATYRTDQTSVYGTIWRQFKGVLGLIQ